MNENYADKMWTHHNMSRREFLRRFGIASSALTLSPFFLDRLAQVCEANGAGVKVYQVKNGDCFQNMAKLWEMLGGPSRFIGPNDIVVIKGNAQWPNQGYTHTGCMKGVIDGILGIPHFSGEILICDNTQLYGSAGQFGFDADVDHRVHNWPDHNWNSLAAAYQASGKPVAVKRWLNDPGCYTAKSPVEGESWRRAFFAYHDYNTYYSYPIFASPLTPGRLIDMKNGVWEGGGYTGQKVKTIFMPTLNTHGEGTWNPDHSGVTSAIKSFFGATEIHSGVGGVWNDYYNVHPSSFGRARPDYAGELHAQYMLNMYTPVLYITAAMWSGHYSRTGAATETKTILACENPATLDYVACKHVISPYAPWLNPDNDSDTRQQILGCIAAGVGTITPGEFEIITYDFNNPTYSRLEIERMIKSVKAGSASEQEAKAMIKAYMENK
jgi:hypothetical protein